MPRKIKHVSDSKRKRAIFSCDWCKLRKRACCRFKNGTRVFDGNTPCTECVKGKRNCITTFKRRARNHGQNSDLKYHLECLQRIVKAMFPETDPNNIDDLRSMAKALFVSLPDTDTGININESIFKGQSTNSTKAHINFRGGSNVFNALLQLGNNNKGRDDILRFENHGLDSAIGSAEIPNLQKYLMINLIPQSEAEKYTEVFFKKVHSSYFIFNEERFRSRMDIYFRDYPVLASNNYEQFTSEEICTMYLVWVLGRNTLLSMGAPNENINVVADTIIARYLRVINLCLSDFVFSKSIDSVRMLYLAALYHDTLKNRETCWLLLSNCCLKCISMGFHRNQCIRKLDPDLQEEIRIVWWSSFRLQVNNSAILGKLPVFSLQDVNLDLPKLDCVEDPLFKASYFKSVSLLKVMYSVLKNREYLLSSNDPWSKENIGTVMKLQRSLIHWKETCDINLQNYKTNPPKRYCIKMHLQFHYVSMSLSLPYLLEVSIKMKGHMNNKTAFLTPMCYGLSSAVELTNVLQFSVESHLINGLLYYDLFYAYNALMVLLLGYTLTKEKSSDENSQNYSLVLYTLEKTFSIDSLSILKAIETIRSVNEKYGDKAVGVMKESSEKIKLLLKHFKLDNSNNEVTIYRKKELDGTPSDTNSIIAGAPNFQSIFQSSENFQDIMNYYFSYNSPSEWTNVL